MVAEVCPELLLSQLLIVGFYYDKYGEYLKAEGLLRLPPSCLACVEGRRPSSQAGLEETG